MGRRWIGLPEKMLVAGEGYVQGCPLALWVIVVGIILRPIAGLLICGDHGLLAIMFVMNRSTRQVIVFGFLDVGQWRPMVVVGWHDKIMLVAIRAEVVWVSIAMV